MTQQREETVWGELVTYLQGGRIPSKRPSKAILDHFALIEELLYFVRDKTDGSLHYSLIVPRRLTVPGIQHAHEKKNDERSGAQALKATPPATYGCNK